MAQVLQIPADNFDKAAVFVVECPVKRRGEIQIRLLRAYVFVDRKANEFWALQKAACIQAVYSDEDRAQNARLNAAEPVRDGDLVEIEGKAFRFKLQGDYSNCGKFLPA